MDHRFSGSILQASSFCRSDLLGMAIENIGNPIVIIDTEDRIVWANHAFSNYSGLSIQEVIGFPTNSVFKYTDGIASYRSLIPQYSEAESSWNRHLTVKADTGRERHAQEIVTVLRDCEGQITHYVSVLHDMATTYDALQIELVRAGRDPLTGLAGRAQIFEAIVEGIRSQHANDSLLALLFVDLDGFKQVNDIYGHLAGDALLQAVSSRLLGTVRATDTVGRFGGDEFVIVLPSVANHAVARDIGRKLVEQLAQPFAMESGFHRIGASIGMSFSPEHGNDGSALLSRADTAMYAAKRAGGNRLMVFRGNDDACSPCHARHTSPLPALLSPVVGAAPPDCFARLPSAD